MAAGSSISSAVYVHLGNSIAITFIALVPLQGAAMARDIPAGFGTAIAGGAFFSPDMPAAVLVTAPNAGGGRALLFRGVPGAAGGVAVLPSDTAEPSMTPLLMGSAVGCPGDLNADGSPDCFIGGATTVPGVWRLTASGTGMSSSLLMGPGAVPGIRSVIAHLGVLPAAGSRRWGRWSIGG